MSTHVLFLCPHNAAKSVAASAFLSRAATEAGVAVTVSTAGTDPGDAVLPVVGERLERDGFAVSHVPVTVTVADMDHADRIINIGCAHRDLPATHAVVDWSIPDFSEDPAAAFAAIQAHVMTLVSALADDC